MLRVWLCAVLLAGVALGYDIEQFKQDAKAYHDGHLKQLDGLKLVLSGQVTEPGHDTYVIDATYYSRGARWRADATIRNPEKPEGFPFTVLFDGQQTWAQLLGMKMDIEPSDVNDRMRGYAYWNEPDAGSKVAGEETINGRACWLIETPLKESDGTKVTMKSWYDKERFVLVQSESTYDKKPVRMEFSDFRDVAGGYVIPHAMRAVQNDVQLVEARITETAHGEAVSSALLDASSLEGADFPDMAELMRTFQIFGKAFGNEVSKLLKAD